MHVVLQSDSLYFFVMFFFVCHQDIPRLCSMVLPVGQFQGLMLVRLQIPGQFCGLLREQDGAWLGGVARF